MCAGVAAGDHRVLARWPKLRDLVRIAATVLVLGDIPVAAQAAGTAAGTVISNTATLTYSLAGIPSPKIDSAPAVFTVDQLLNLALTWQDGSSVAVTTPGTNSALTFLLTNTGNGPATSVLARNNALAGDNYDPLNGSAGAIFLESGAAPGFQASGPNADVLYIPGTNDPLLAASASRVVYVVSNTPAALANGNIGTVALTASSTVAGAAGAAPGTLLPGLGIGGIDAVVGTTRAEASQNGSYLVGGVVVSVAKSVLSVLDTQGGSTVSSGSIITYQIVVSAVGTGIAQGLGVADPIPATATYIANSILVDGAARTDAVDGDNAEYLNGVVQARFGDSPAPASHTVQFRVTIN
jgi:uncharacterized repeat protein (TIGR01451 family)